MDIKGECICVVEALRSRGLPLNQTEFLFDIWRLACKEMNLGIDINNEYNSETNPDKLKPFVKIWALESSATTAH